MERNEFLSALVCICVSLSLSLLLQGIILILILERVSGKGSRCRGGIVNTRGGCSSERSVRRENRGHRTAVRELGTSSAVDVKIFTSTGSRPPIH